MSCQHCPHCQEVARLNEASFTYKGILFRKENDKYIADLDSIDLELKFVETEWICKIIPNDLVLFGMRFTTLETSSTCKEYAIDCILRELVGALDYTIDTFQTKKERVERTIKIGWDGVKRELGIDEESLKQITNND